MNIPPNPWPIALLLVLACSPALPAQSGTKGRRETADTIKVDVKLVNVFLTVTDQRGSPAASLERADFEILEDGIPQTVAIFERESALPLSIVLAVDASLSTRKDLKFEIESARRFVHSILRPVDGLALYRFAENVDELVSFSNSLSNIDRGLDRLRQGSGTALYDAIYLAAEALLDRQGRKVMVLISDGGDTTSKADYAAALRAAQEAETMVYSIIIVPIEASAGRNTGGEHALIQLSRETGGRYYYAGSALGLEQAFRQIDQELRTQYLLAYYPSRRLSDSEFRRITVRVKEQALAGGETPDHGPQFLVRHRGGYYTSKPR